MAIKRDAADSWFSKCVRKRASDKCEHCHAPASDCAHIFGRREKSLRWDGDNAVALCRACHMRFTANPIDFTRWLEDHIGRQMLEILQEKRQHKLKTTTALRKEIAAHYREQFNGMEYGREFESWA